MPQGFVYDLALQELPIEERAFTARTEECEVPEISIDYPPEARNGSILPIPLNFTVSFIAEDSPISPPTPLDPIHWRVRAQRGKALAYSITRSTYPTFDREQTTPLIPSEQEQEYWQKALGMPPQLRKLLHIASKGEGVNSVLDVASYWMNAREPNTYFSNFRYVNHARLGRFIRDNSEHLPIVMSELKVGHCDLLAWYGAAAMRSIGTPAWITTVRLTTRDGSAFNDSALHAQVAFLDSRGELAVWDPTSRARFDPSYHPSVLKNSRVERLERDFRRSGSEAARREVLRAFAREQKEKRDEWSNRDKMRSLSQEFATFLSGLMDALDGGTGGDHFWGATALASQLNTPRKVYQMYSELTSIADVPDFGEDADVAPEVTMVERLSDENLPKLGLVLNALKRHRMATPSEFSQRLDDSVEYREDGVIPGSMEWPGVFRDRLIVTDCQNPFRSRGFSPRRRILYQMDEQLQSISAGIEQVRPAEYIPLAYLQFFCLLSDNSGTVVRDPLLPGLRQFFQKSIFPVVVSSDWTPDRLGSFISGPKEERTQDGHIRFSNSPMASRQIFELKVDFQRGMRDKSARDEFCSRAGITEKEFFTLGFSVARVDPNGKRADGILSKPSPETSSSFRFLSESFYLENDCALLLRRTFQQAIRSLDNEASRTPTTELEENRPYGAGDDLRRVNWKLFGRTDKLWARSNPSRALSHATPLHVVIDDSIVGVDDSGQNHLHALQLVELLKRMNDREVFITRSS
ncbi:MAG: DUF58 domain-containing protein, partial [Bdellovibrionales bacterium]|nr:DUF58 domain-containing protein [Bdellovibrionales bacterium]